MAFKVVHQLGQTLTQGCLPVFTSDGLNFYFYALTAHFGQWIHEPGQRKPRWQVAANLLYAQVLKTYRRRQITRVAQRVQCGTLEAVKAMLQQLGFSGRINTAFIERANLTVRQGVAALARRTWATAQSLGELRLQLSWWRAYYHFVRPPAALRLPLAFSPCDSRQRYRPRTPAMAAGLTDHRWTVVEFLALALPPQPA